MARAAEDRREIRRGRELRRPGARSGDGATCGRPARPPATTGVCSSDDRRGEGRRRTLAAAAVLSGLGIEGRVRRKETGRATRNESVRNLRMAGG
jgi:hypothetical protein